VFGSLTIANSAPEITTNALSATACRNPTMMNSRRFPTEAFGFANIDIQRR
jgi:hypothetical protein